MRRGVGSAPFLNDRAMGRFFKDKAADAMVMVENEGEEGRRGNAWGQQNLLAPRVSSSPGLWLTFQETSVSHRCKSIVSN